MTKYETLKQNLLQMEKVLVAFSGGLDSALLVKVAMDVLGKENVLAVTADSESYTKEELKSSQQFAETIGLDGNHLIIKTYETRKEEYLKNPLNRCYFCKQELFFHLFRIAKEKNIAYVLDGYNASDRADFRPGRKAAKEFGVRSPLAEVGLEKEELRKIAQDLGLQVWDKPSLACLSSRVPYGTYITMEKLKQIAEAEKFLKELGFKQFRVRHHDQIARIEVEKTEFEKFLDSDLREKIYQKFKELGFVYTTLDILGYRTGSMNEPLQNKNSK